jgi:hypothetical protein
VIRLSLHTIEYLAACGDEGASAAKREWKLLSELANDDVKVFAWRTSSDKIVVALGYTETYIERNCNEKAAE